MLEQVQAFKSFITGHQDCFCCEDCDQEEDCLTLYHAQKLIETIEATCPPDAQVLPEALEQEMTKIFDKLQECAWQRCDCRTRY